jgi:putative Mg2+ transporter-C (MgtC) family protein
MDLVSLISIAPLSWKSIGAAILCGAIIGLERQLRGKPVGIRTSSLIVLGTYVFLSISIQVTNEVADPSRIIGQIVTGVGFLGAGVMLAKDGMVIGVTSAATIWVLAAVGCCIPIIGEGPAIKISILVVVILWGVDLLEDYSTTFSRGVHARYTNWKGKG